MAILTYHAGRWNFELDARVWSSVGNADPAYLERFLSKIQQCINILKKDELFVPSLVTLSDWIDIDGEGMSKLVIEDDSVEIASPTDVQLAQVIAERINAKQHLGVAVRPRSVEIRGGTRLEHRDSESRKIADLVSVDASFMGGGEIMIRLFSDVWLPFLLDGNTANAAYPKYADMLEKAMSEVERALGVEPSFDKDSDICCVNGYRLENFTDSDGEILGVDAYGSVL